MSGGLLVAGTQSDAGKSLLTAGICRWLRRRGVRVAPFKAQNMALNSAVTPGGAEIGRAQALQAAAAGVPAEAAMNPVLIKPSGERHSQVVLMGRPFADADARSYQQLKRDLREPVLAAFEDLRARFDAVICEGAGSPAEINLRAGDLANMGLARAARLPVVVVGNIDRGGVFASFYGTLALLEPADQELVAGFVVNKFRGDPGILAPGLEQIEWLTGRPVLGTVPYRDGLGLDAEDSLALERQPAEVPPAAAGGDALEVVVLRLRWISNFTDVDALAAEPGVRVRFTRSPADVERADLVLVPGTKATVEDLERLRSLGLADALRRRAAAGQPLLGVCGGYQLLGERIEDAVESRRGAVDGLGLLPVDTVFDRDKLVRQVAGTFVGPGVGERSRPGARELAQGALDGPGAAVGLPATGYEIRHGRLTRRGGAPLLADGSDAGEGCVEGAVIGTSWHGLLETDEVRRALLSWVADCRGRSWVPGSEPFAAVRERQLDRLGDLVEEHVDTAALLELIERGPRPDLPVLAPGGARCSYS